MFPVCTELFPSKSLRACLPGVLILLASLAASAQIIKTVAGGVSSNPGVRSLNACSPIRAAAPFGTDIYVESCNVIYKVDTSGAWTPVAGTGASGNSGDGGLALSATLRQPASISVDGAGNIFFVDHAVDHNNNGTALIREFTVGGNIKTVAGGGSGCLLQTDSVGDGCPATAAQIACCNPLGPTVFAYGSENVLIADSFNSRVRKFTVGGTIQTIAGTGDFTGSFADGIDPLTAEIPRPYAVLVDGSNNIFIADGSGAGKHRIWEIDAAGPLAGLIHTVAGGNGRGYLGDGFAATSAKLNQPAGLFVDASNNIYVAENGNNVIRKFTVGGSISTVAGNGTFGFPGFIGDGGPATSAELNSPHEVFTDASGNIFIVESFIGVREVVGGTIQPFVKNSVRGFSGEGGPAINAQLSAPIGAVEDASGNIFLVDGDNNVVQKVVAATGVLQRVAGNGTFGYSGDNGPPASAQLGGPLGLFMDGAGNIFIADSGNNVIREIVKATGLIQTVAGNFALGGGYSGDGGLATNAALNYPTGVFVDTLGNIFVTDSVNCVIREFTLGGNIQTVAGNFAACPGFGGDGGPATSAALNYPNAVFVDSSENIFIADWGNNVIREFTVGGSIQTVAGNFALGSGFNGDGELATSAQLAGPQLVSGDTLGNLFIADWQNDRIREFTVGGSIQTVAGTGIEDFTGDGGPATVAELNQPISVFVGPSGSLLIGDTPNGRIRVVGGVPESLNAASATFGVGAMGSLHVTASASPSLTLIESGALPNGVTFNSATGMLIGTPAVGTDVTSPYHIGFTAANGIWSDVVQNFTLTVLPVQTIGVTAGTLSLPRGSAEQFTATGTYSDAVLRDVTASATWTSSRTTVATITATGFATAVANGNTNITAAVGSASGFAVLAVPPPALTGITVTPPSPSIAVAKTQQFTATGTYSDGTMKNITTTVTWTSDTTSVATISSSGLATGVAPGMSTIRATLGISGTATLTVQPALVSIAISTTVNPPSISVTKSPKQAPFTAIGTYNNGSTQTMVDITDTVTWTSSKPGIASISNASGTNGVATAVAKGNTNIYATVGKIKSPQITLTVIP